MNRSVSTIRSGSSLYLLFMCLVFTIPLAAQSLPPELAEFRQRVLNETQQQQSAWSLRQAQPVDVSNPDNPLDFVGVAHNQILAKGLQEAGSPNARVRPRAAALRHWQTVAQSYLDGVVPPNQRAAAAVMKKKACKIDPFHPWRCNIWKNPGPEDGQISLWRDARPALDEEELERAKLDAMVEDLYGNVHPEQVTFAVEILHELYSLTTSNSLASFVSDVKRLERRILATNLMSLEEKVPLLVVTSTARHSFAFSASTIHLRDTSSDDKSSEVVRADLSGAADGASVGFILGGPWGAAFGGVLLGAIHSGLEYESQQSIASLGGDGGDDSTGGDSTTGSDGWTPWLNRDGPNGSGDYETLRDFVAAGQACDNPTDIQCQTLDGKSWQELGRPYTCDTQTGGVCRNVNQEDGRCPDFRVRFRCG